MPAIRPAPVFAHHAAQKLVPARQASAPIGAEAGLKAGHTYSRPDLFIVASTRGW
jgi:hypothetical protein